VIGKYEPPFTVASLQTMTHFAARDAPDSSDDAGGGRFPAVHPEGRQWRQLEKGRPGVEELLDTLARE